MSTHNICFYGQLTKIIIHLSSNTLLICSSDKHGPNKFLIPYFSKFYSVARQMKTINYQLSSQKCLEEGWTLRAPSPLLDDLGDNVFEPEPLDPAMIAEGRVGLHSLFLR